MKRRKRKSVRINEPEDAPVLSDFTKDCQLIQYNEEEYLNQPVADVEELIFSNIADKVSWLNIYGFQYHSKIRKIIRQNHLDEFISYLTAESNHRNKAIELPDCFFFSVKSLYYKSNISDLNFEQLMFICSSNFVWSIQEVRGDHFAHIRARIKEKIGLVRRKGADYLFYLLIEAIIENYYQAFENSMEEHSELQDFNIAKPTPEYASKVESFKANLLQIKKAAGSLREAINQLDKMELDYVRNSYMDELREMINHMNDSIDVTLNQLESSINMIFSIQNHRLNEVMKTLTIFSVIFIPLTFLAGIYGMNFEFIPELKYHYGYFYLLGIMLIISLISIIIIKRKKWF